MPLFYQQNINEHTRLAIWEIREAEPFFTEAVTVQRTISHPHKRLQHLAGRYLLSYLFPDFPSWLIRIADTRKPFLEGQPYQFSISHSENYAAALVSKTCQVGVDIELASPKIALIRRKFLSDGDAAALGLDASDTTMNELDLTIAWSAKEAVYKWWGLGEVDFKKDIRFDTRISNGQTGYLDCTFNKPAPQPLKVYYHLFSSLVLAWVMEP
ncbi:MAG: 4'-phosphopantetheinyl transferase superfamily protein [Williamsia sp.]|nr:4'-phosphopantetheinyl transferase superfamily protein [Williamsia sp.]